MSARNDILSPRPAAKALTLFVSCALAGCAVGPDFKRPEPPVATQYTFGTEPTQTVQSDGQTQRFERSAMMTADWWRLFRSRQLDALIEEAIAGNPGLEAARASLRESENSLRGGYGIFFPQADINASAARQRYSPLRLGQELPSSVFNLFTLSASVSYALDIFGGQRRTVEGLRAQSEVAEATANATFLTLAANIVNTTIARAAYRAQIEATRELIDMQREQVRIAEVQSEAGTVPYSNVLSLRSQLAAYEATIPQLEQKSVQSAHLLATLSGQLPAQWSAPEVELSDLTLPLDLPVSVPSELVRQRPDILAAEAQAHAASAGIGVATAAMLPSLSLNAEFGSNSLDGSDLFRSDSRFWGAAGNVAAPVFHGGSLWFRRKAAIEVYGQAMAQYRQTVLAAFGQVADTLRALEHDAQALRAQGESLAAAAEALHLVQVNYDAGTTTYLDVLNANEQYLQAKLTELQLKATRYQDTVALFAAMGGGWWVQPGK